MSINDEWMKIMYHLYVMKYYSVLKKGRKSYHLQQHIDGPERHYAKSNKPVTEEQVLHGSLYMGHIK